MAGVPFSDHRKYSDLWQIKYHQLENIPILPPLPNHLEKKLQLGKLEKANFDGLDMPGQSVEGDRTDDARAPDINKKRL